MTAAGSGAPGSWIVSSSETWSPLESLTVHSSSSAATDEPVGDEVGLLDVRGQARGHAAGHVLDQRRVRDDEAFARSLITGTFVPAPQVLELDRLDVGLQSPSLPQPYATRADVPAHR